MSTNIKLSPPQIDISLPPIVAIAYNEKTKESAEYTITVPLYSNPAVALGDIVGISLLIKTVSTGVNKETVNYIFDPLENIAFNQDITISLTKSYNIGQYYKIQYAFLSKGINEQGEEIYITGHWSTVGISKCTVNPTIAIKNLEKRNNDDIYYGDMSYVGEYHSIDTTEKVYSYCFTIMDGTTVFDTSGVLLHDVSNDTDKNTSTDIWVSSKMLPQRQKYTITYEVTTINGLTIKTEPYIIQSGQHGFIATDGEFIATLQEEDGCVNLHFKNMEHKLVMLDAGNYVITRASSKDNFEYWIKICDFILPQNTENVHFLNDYTVEQGVSYRYGLQLVKPNKQLTARKEALYYTNIENESSNNRVSKLQVDFEDAFLSDGDRQLCIRYNPKVASFKSTILESKIDTLGGKHPFIFRNGNINYKEFSISGLISMLMDKNGHFLPATAKDDMARFTTPGYLQSSNSSETNLTMDNFAKERNFKMEVLSWLTNGKPKVFRAPGEGNYIIRTMNVSLTPNDTLGRMLHTFNCTAYEIADFNMSNLLQYNLIKNQIEVEPKKIMVFDERTMPLTTEVVTFSQYGGGIRYLCFENVYNDYFIKLNDDKNQIYNIGNATGKYIFPMLFEEPITTIQLVYPTTQVTKLTYGYYRQDKNISEDSFYDTIASVKVHQFIGGSATAQDSNQNLVDCLISENEDINYCYLVKVQPKPIIYMGVNKDDNSWVYASLNKDGLPILSSHEVYLDPTVLYYDVVEKHYKVYTGMNDGSKEYNTFEEANYNFTLNDTMYSSLEPAPISTYFINATRLLSNELNNLYDNKDAILLAVNDASKPVEQKQLITGGRFNSITNVGQLQTLKIGNGLICDLVYELYTYQRAEGEKTL